MSPYFIGYLYLSGIYICSESMSIVVYVLLGVYISSMSIFYQASIRHLYLFGRLYVFGVDILLGI